MYDPYVYIKDLEKMTTRVSLFLTYLLAYLLA